MKKKLVLMIPQLKFGGAERVVSRLSFLLNKDFDLNIVVFDDKDITYDIGCQLYSLDVPPNIDNNFFNKILNVFKRIYRYRKFKKKNNIDFTYSFGDTANLINVFSFGKDKKISSIRGYKRIRKNKGLKNKLFLRPLSKYIISNSDATISVSELITKTIIKEYNVCENKIHTIYNGYDTESIKKLAKESLTSEENRYFNNNKIIITAGTFRPEKGYWHLLKAFSLVLKEKKNVKLIIIGQDYNNYKKRVEKLAEELNIREEILFLGYQKNLFKYLSKSDVYVLPSTFEGFPNAMVEAMACGVPIVASDCESGPREILDPKSDLFSEEKYFNKSEYGILVKKMNPIEDFDSNTIEEEDKYLAQAINVILDDKQLAKNYSEKSKDRSNDFSTKEWYKRNLSIINKILL